jgi:hypothetical protein
VNDQWSDLASWAGDAEEMGKQQYALQEMAERLERGGYYMAARQTREVLRSTQITGQLSEPLGDVWRAVAREWQGKCGEDQVAEAAAKLQQWPPEVPG